MTMLHPSLPAWQRHEDGAYEAQRHGYTLSVRWKSDARLDGAHGFVWSATRAENDRYVAPESAEEPEVAMAHAEAWAAAKSNAPPTAASSITAP